MLRELRETRRLQRLDEVLDPSGRRGVDFIACTNAIHLYGDLGLAYQGARAAAGRQLFINSGNIRNPRAKPNNGSSMKPCG